MAGPNKHLPDAACFSGLANP